MQLRAYNPLNAVRGKLPPANRNAFAEEARMHLKISMRQTGDVTIVDLDGRIVIGLDNDSLHKRLEELTQRGARKVLVNLTNVTHLDSSGISTIVRAFISMQHSGGSFKILHPGGHVREVLEVTHLTNAIPTFDDEAAAMASFGSAARSAGRKLSLSTYRERSHNSNRRFPVAAAVVVFFFCVAIPLYAQQPQIDLLAAKVASAIHKSFRKAAGRQLVMVVISEPVIGPTELGATIANQFRSALAARGISLMSSAQLQQTQDEEKIPLVVLRDPGTFACAASDADATVIVAGTLQRSGDRLNLATTALRAENAKVFFKGNVHFDRTPELAELQDRPVPSPPVRKTTESKTNIPEAGKNGYTHPTCLHCPPPQYSKRAFRMREQGKIVLDTIIGVDGRAHSVTVLQGLACGLDQQALDAVENAYRFGPANGPDGKPAAVRMPFEIEFRIY